MEYKEEFLKSKITDLTNQYKAIATLSAVAATCNDVKNINLQYEILNGIHGKIINLVSKFCREEIVLAVRELDLDILPDYMKSIRVIAEYKKILALRYSGVVSKKDFDFVDINKKSIDFECREEMAYLNIVRLLYKKKKYVEVIRLCELLNQFTTGYSLWYFVGKSYVKLGQVGKALRAYNTYLEGVPNDKNIKNEIKKLYKEMVK